MIQDFPDLCTYVYGLVDEPYQVLVAPHDHRPGPRAEFSDSEVITLTVVAELLGLDEDGLDPGSCSIPDVRIVGSWKEERMGKPNYTEAQIVAALRRAEGGTPVAEVCRKLGVSEQTYYRWKKKYAGMGVAELRRLKQLEEENKRLKGLVADLTLDKQMLQEVITKKL